MLFALPSYQFPYNVMNKCLYLRLHVSLALGGLEVVHGSGGGGPWLGDLVGCPWLKLLLLDPCLLT